jgi:dipeptidase E
MTTDVRRLLLLSSSRTHGTAFLDHAAEEILRLLAGRREIWFAPFALEDMDAYAQIAREWFARLGCRLHSLHQETAPAGAIESAEALFIGGGNTFRLLSHLYRLDLLQVIRHRVAEGMAYLGASAGSNVACPTIKTTNDMPIVQPPSFEALALVDFQINPHYVDPDPSSTHMGETREQRIREFHEENDTPVIGLREGAMLRVEDRQVLLAGTRGGRVFRRGQGPVEVATGSAVEDLLA